MRGATLVALAATISYFLQGWDNATIAGSIIYIKKDMNLQSSVEGLVVAMSLLGATAITTCSGPISDWLGRHPMLIFSSMSYFIGSLIMLWSPSVYILCLARLLIGFGYGLAVTVVPIYISETAPPDIRGLLNTLPQFMSSTGMFLSYCMVFVMSLSPSPSWRVMLGVLSIPSLFFLSVAVFYLPESPSWLVSKGKMVEAKKVLQRLRGWEDVSNELALLVEGLGIGGVKSIEEFTVGVADGKVDDRIETTHDAGAIRLHGPHENVMLIARPVQGQSSVGLRSRHESLASQSMSFKDPLVYLFNSVHEKLPDAGVSMKSTHSPSWAGGISKSTHSPSPNLGSIFSSSGPKNTQDKDLENQYEESDESASASTGGDSDDDLRSPLISRQNTGTDMETSPRPTNRSTHNLRSPSNLIQEDGEAAGAMGIGGGWQLAYKWNEKDGGYKRYYLKEDGAESLLGSTRLLPSGHESHDVAGAGNYICASAIASQPALCSKSAIGPAMVHPSESVSKAPLWSALLDPGVKRALIVGIGLQILQQFSGIIGVLYYTPQILKQAGVGVLLSNTGLSSASSSFLISALTTFLMLPCIAMAMRLMDISGRRALLLATIPVLIVSLVVLVISQLVHLSIVFNAIVSIACIVICFCFFVMGYGPIPFILCSEIFPTRVRGLCITICSMAFWIGDITVTYSLPVMLSSIGLVGVFSIFAVVCVISWIFIFLKVPETKGMPLEVITEFFAIGGQPQAEAAKDV